jgi:serine protease Do
MIKKINLLAVIILIATMVAACGGATSPADTGAPAQTEAPVVTQAPAATTAPAASDFVTVKDDTGAMEVSVPAAWKEVDGSVFELGTAKIKFASIKAAPSISDFGSFAAPGTWVLASSQLAQLGGYIQVLDIWKDGFVATGCQYGSRTDYSDDKYEGKYDFFTNCKNTGNAFMVLVVRPIQNQTAYLVTVIINSPSSESADTANKGAKAILDSFNVIGDLPN